MCARIRRWLRAWDRFWSGVDAKADEVSRLDIRAEDPDG